jgi:hypothetical protein
MSSSGSGAATSQTKSHPPRSHTASRIEVQSRSTVASCWATRRGVNPRLTRERRRWCSGLSIEIIIGRAYPWGRGARRLENVAASFSMASTSS